MNAPLADVMTDMVARPKSLKTMLTEEFANRNFLCAQEISSLNEMAEDIEVHAGMAEAAIFIFQQVNFLPFHEVFFHHHHFIGDFAKTDFSVKSSWYGRSGHFYFSTGRYHF